MAKKIKILFTGGGTGGHIMPLISVIREVKRLHGGDELKLSYIGPRDKESFELLSKENVKTYTIASGKIRRYFSLMNVVDIFFGIPLGFFQSLILILFISPKIVFSKGGSGATVVTKAAHFWGTPIFIHESDAVPGLSNRSIAKSAKKIFTSFPTTEFFDAKKVTIVGNPIRKEILTGDKNQAKEMLSLSLERPVILVIGGSQGAEAINEFILLMLNELLKKYEVIHVAGPKNYTRVEIQSKFILQGEGSKYYHLYRFLNEVELKNAYQVADVIISRAGASSIFEIAALGKPAILIPLPTAAGNHQSKNAYQYAKSGGGVVMEQENLSPNLFLGEIDLLLSRAEAFKERALQFSKPNAAEDIAKALIEYVQAKK